MKLGRLFDVMFLLVIALFIMTSCGPTGSKSADGSAANSSKISFNLTDAPNDDLQNVFVNVKSIEVKLSKGSKAAKVHVAKGLGIVDLLQLQNGLSLLMDELEIPAGVYVEQIRFILDDGNFLIRKDGSQCDLKTPSAEHSGLKIFVPRTVTMDGNYNFSVLVDFDAKLSIVQNGNGDCLLKPVIKLTKASRKHKDHDRGDKHGDKNGDENSAMCASKKSKSHGHHDHQGEHGENHEQCNHEDHDDDGHDSDHAERDESSDFSCEAEEEDLLPVDGSSDSSVVQDPTPVPTTTTIAAVVEVSPTPTPEPVVDTTTTTSTTTTVAPTATTVPDTTTATEPVVIDRTRLADYFNIQ